MLFGSNSGLRVCACVITQPNFRRVFAHMFPRLDSLEIYSLYQSLSVPVRIWRALIYEEGFGRGSGFSLRTIQ